GQSWPCASTSIWKATARPSSPTPASLASKALCRSGSAHTTVLEDRRTGSSSRTRRLRRGSARRRRIGAAKGGGDTIALFSRRAMKGTNDGSSDSFVIPCLSTALGWVERYCLLELLRRRRWLGLDDFRTDLYVIGHFGLAFVAYVLSFWVSFTYEVNLTLGALVILYSA